MTPSANTQFFPQRSEVPTTRKTTLCNPKPCRRHTWNLMWDPLQDFVEHKQETNCVYPPDTLRALTKPAAETFQISKNAAGRLKTRPGYRNKGETAKKCTQISKHFSITSGGWRVLRIPLRPVASIPEQKKRGIAHACRGPTDATEVEPCVHDSYSRVLIHLLQLRDLLVINLFLVNLVVFVTPKHSRTNVTQTFLTQVLEPAKLRYRPSCRHCYTTMRCQDRTGVHTW